MKIKSERDKWFPDSCNGVVQGDWIALVGWTGGFSERLFLNQVLKDEIEPSLSSCGKSAPGSREKLVQRPQGRNQPEVKKVKEISAQWTRRNVAHVRCERCTRNQLFFNPQVQKVSEHESTSDRVIIKHQILYELKDDSAVWHQASSQSFHLTLGMSMTEHNVYCLLTAS